MICTRGTASEGKYESLGEFITEKKKDQDSGRKRSELALEGAKQDSRNGEWLPPPRSQESHRYDFCLLVAAVPCGLMSNQVLFL